MFYADYSDCELRRRIALGDADAMAEGLRRYGDALGRLLRAWGIADPDRGLQLTLLEAASNERAEGSLWKVLQQAAATVAKRLRAA